MTVVAAAGCGSPEFIEGSAGGIYYVEGQVKEQHGSISLVAEMVKGMACPP